jgi:hypothetical protein
MQVPAGNAAACAADQERSHQQERDAGALPVPLSARHGCVCASRRALLLCTTSQVLSLQRSSPQAGGVRAGARQVSEQPSPTPARRDFQQRHPRLLK